MKKLPIKHSPGNSDIWTLFIPIGVAILIVVFAACLSGCGKTTKVLTPTCCAENCTPDKDDERCPHDDDEDDIRSPGALPLPPSFAPPSTPPVRTGPRVPAKAAPSPAS